jgi:hypothetical protein
MQAGFSFRGAAGVRCGRFDQPIVLPDGRKLAMLRTALAYLSKIIPKGE